MNTSERLEWLRIRLAYKKGRLALLKEWSNNISNHIVRIEAQIKEIKSQIDDIDK